MPSEKPKIVIYSSKTIVDKLDYIANMNNRSRGNMCETVIKAYIEQYEQEHGDIPVDGV